MRQLVTNSRQVSLAMPVERYCWTDRSCFANHPTVSSDFDRDMQILPAPY